jgi:EAL domain-containing protein (putative c-di-GMP-specific phosphodiesterase class I)
MASIPWDRAFVRDPCRYGNDESIVRAIIQMAHALNLRTIAEGVEDEATLACLRQLECDEVRGYLIAKPMPGDQVAAFICEHAVCVSPLATPPESRGSLSLATGRA